jgi:hypothetical protein
MCGELDQPALQGKFTIAVPGATDIEFSMPAEWSADHRLQGVAYLWVMLKYDATVFPTGAPTISMTVDGRRVYDPRPAAGQDIDDDSTWTFSSNWALCVYDYMRNREFGMGIDPNDIDTASIIAAAGIADQDVANIDENGATLTPATSKRYQIHAIFQTTDLPGDILPQMLAAGAGRLLFIGGKYYLYAGATASPSFTLTRNDAAGPISILPTPARDERCNTVRATYTNPDKSYEPDAIPPITADEYVAQDGGLELADDIDYLYVCDKFQAQRLAKIHLRQKRHGLTCEWPVKPAQLGIIPWDVGYIKDSDLGWDSPGMPDGYEVRVEDVKIAPEGNITFSMRAHSANIWSDEAVVDVPLPPDTTLPDPFYAPPPAAVTATEASYVRTDGTRASQIVVTVTRSTSESYFSEYVIRYYRTGTTTEILRTIHTDDDVTYITDVPEGSYEVAVTQRTTYGKESNSVVASVDVTYQTSPPPGATNLRVVQLSANRKRFSWIAEAALPADFRGWELRYVTGHAGTSPSTTDWDAARTLGTVRDDLFYETFRPRGAGDYTIYLRGKDRSGFYSNTIAAIEITVAAIDSQTILAEVDYNDLGWPGVHANCYVNGAGGLEAHQGVTWADTTTWAAAGSWAAPGSTEVHFGYWPGVIDLGDLRTFYVDATYNGTGTITIHARASADANLTETFRPVSHAPLVGRYLEIGVAGHGTGHVAITDLVVRVRAFNQEEIVDDLDPTTIATNRFAFRQETTEAMWCLAERQFNTIVSSNVLQPRPRVSFGSAAAGYIQAADNALLRVASRFTIEFAFRPLANNTAAVVIAKGTDWYVEWTSNAATDTQTLQFKAAGYTGDNPETSAAISVTDAFHWHHAAFTYDGAVFRGLLDGAIAFELPRVFSLAQSSDVVTIGGRSSSAKVNGELQDVRIWDHARSRSSIAGAINLPVYAQVAGLVAYWPLDDLTGSSARDLAPHALTGTRNGTISRVRSATRESPILNLGIVRTFGRNIGISWKTTTSGTSTVTIQKSTDGGSTWTDISSVNPSFLTEFSNNQDLIGKTLRLRMLLRSTAAADTPQLSELTVSLPLIKATGDFVYKPTLKFASITNATITAIQDTTYNLTGTIVAKTPLGVRVRLTDTLGVLRDATVDLSVRGPVLP